MILVIILIIICVLYLIDNGVCAVYCKRKSNKSVLKLQVEIENKENRDSGKHTSTEHKAGLKDKIAIAMVGWIRYRLIRLGKFPSHTYRMFLLRHVFKMEIGEDAVIHAGFEIRDPWNIRIGNGSIIGDNCILDGRNGLVIGENVNFSTGVWIWTEEHDHNDPEFACNNKGGKVVIKDRAWVSCRTIILPNVHIGEGAILAAGAVATKDCADFKIYGGVPAKVIGERSRDLRYVFDGSTIPFY